MSLLVCDALKQHVYNMYVTKLVPLFVTVTRTSKAAKICDVHGTSNTNLLYKFQGRAILNGITYAEERKINKDKSDISYLESSWAFKVPIHSRALLAAILCWLATLWHHE